MWEFILLLGLAGNLTLDKQYEASDKILNIIPYSENNVERIIYYRMINAYELNRKDECIKYADLLLNSFVEIPLRYKDLAIIIKGDAESWETEDSSLDDIAREMKIIRDGLARGQPDEVSREGKGDRDVRGVMERQREVENRLKRIIDKEENARADAEASARIEGVEGGMGKIAAPDSIPSQLPNGTGDINSKRIKEIANVWGTLPEKERARALLELTRKMPPKDRVIVESYFKELNRRTSRK